VSGFFKPLLQVKDITLDKRKGLDFADQPNILFMVLASATGHMVSDIIHVVPYFIPDYFHHHSSPLPFRDQDQSHLSYLLCGLGQLQLLP
jgi:hypothetical protein